jgi:sigma-B regulation protein RsbU (phosphoserine phosphatase)
VLSRLLLTAMSKLLVTRSAALLYDAEQQAYRLTVARGLPGLAEGEQIAFSDGAVRDVQRGDDVPAPLREHGFALALPVVVEEQPVGLVALGPKSTGDDFAPEEREFVASLVHLSAAAVRNARLVSELRSANHDLDARVRELDTLFDLSRAFNATRERDPLLKLLAYALMGQTGCAGPRRMTTRKRCARRCCATCAVSPASRSSSPMTSR